MVKPKLELTKKLEANRKKGEAAENRSIFTASIQEFMHTHKFQPYGWLPMYDDMTQKDVLALFSSYKKSRVVYLRKHGINKRKYIVQNEDRDRLWAEMAAEYKGKPDYIEIARKWAEANPFTLTVEFIRHVWKRPEDLNAPVFKEKLLAAKSKKIPLRKFITKAMTTKNLSTILETDFEEYVRHVLPPVISSAVRRWNLARQK